MASLGAGNLLTGGAVQASGGTALRWRLLDFGRVDADVALARGRSAEALGAWRGSALRAAEDVETALSSLIETRTQRSALERQVATLKTTRRQVNDAYTGGVTSLIELVDVDRALLVATDLLIENKVEEGRAAVAAYRALGGGWSSGSPADLASSRQTIR